MEAISNAKINLGLSITSKRPDGFHSIESIFIPIPWNDEIKIKTSTKTEFSSSGILIDGSPSDNLCLKAFQLLQSDFDLPPISIHLTKKIPIGAGLGGGSSNAAFVLKSCNDLFSIGLTRLQLEKYADLLGSDCSFFIQNKVAFVSGKGEILDFEIDLSLNTHCIVVNPLIHINTKEAYSKVTPYKSEYSIFNKIKEPKENWQELIENDFEKALLKDYPVLQKLKMDLHQMGAYYVSMSGSGSTFFAFFKKEPETLLFDKNFQFKSFELNV